MKKIIGLLLYAGVMFGVTAGLGMFMLKKTASHSTAAHEGEEEGTDEDQHGSEANGDHGVAVGHAPADGRHDAHADAGAHGPASKGADAAHDEPLPVAVRSTPMSVEEIVRMGLSLKSRDEVVRKREAALRELEAQQRLGLADLASAQQDIENILAQASDQRAAKEELLARVTAQSESLLRERESLDAEREKLKKEREEFDTTKKSFSGELNAIAQRENDLTIKQNALDEERKKFEEAQAKVTLDTQSLINERNSWVKEKDKLTAEKRQIALDRDQLKVERELFEQQKQVMANTAPSASTVPPGGVPAASQKDIKPLVALFDGWAPEMAAKNIKEMVADGEESERMVVQILMQLEPRKATAIMDAVNDEKLATRFLKIMSESNTNSKAAKKP